MGNKLRQILHLSPFVLRDDRNVVLLLVTQLDAIAADGPTELLNNGELLSATFDGESFAGAIAFDIAGHTMEAQIEGEVAGH